MKYELVQWPESQIFIGKPHCYFVNDEELGSSAYFVREDIYKMGTEMSFEEFEDNVAHIID